jgi:hypothetical protein
MHDHNKDMRALIIAEENECKGDGNREYEVRERIKSDSERMKKIKLVADRDPILKG